MSEVLVVHKNFFRDAIEAIESYQPISEERIRELYSRSIKVEGFEAHEKYVNSFVLVVGVGAVTTHLVEFLIRKSIPVIVVDFDKISISNLERTAIFTREFIGKPKVEAVKAFQKRVNPETLVVPIATDFESFICYPSIKEILGKVVKVIVTGLDNGMALYNVWKFVMQTGIPHVDGSTFHRSAHCYVFPNPIEGPCYLCTTTEEWYKRISKRYSCTSGDDVPEESIMPSFAVSSKLAGDLVFTETCKLLRGVVPEYNEIRIRSDNLYFEVEGILACEGHLCGHIFG